jgi:hypothetical protein
MRIADILYFAPGVKMSDVLVNEASLMDDVLARLYGYYIAPAQHLNQNQQAFPAGLILTCCIDGLVRLDTGVSGTSGQQFVSWVSRRLDSFAEHRLATKFYKDFRCGLVHGMQVCNAGEFSYDIAGTIYIENAVMVVNPRELCSELDKAIQILSKSWREDKLAFSRLQKLIRNDFFAGLSMLKA